MQQYGGKHPKQKDTVSARVVNKHVVFEKEQSVEWSWTTVNGERVAGEAGGDSLCMALQARLENWILL